jgi:PPK2 family polyphosphate:nucleotide phosphotransferase
MADSFSDLLRAPTGTVDLTEISTDATPGFTGGKAEGKAWTKQAAGTLAEQQEKLFAEAYTGGTRRFLLVVQGMDTSGKGGLVKHVIRSVDAVDIVLRSFKRPSEEELAHDFLWRIEKAVPPPGMIGIFDRSHYEDVLVARVRGLVEPDEIERRYDAINEFERRLVGGGTTVVKCMLHISADEQRDRLLARLEDPTKQWKFRPGDIDDRALWDEYQAAYAIALERCNTDHAPWYVIPADRKWYRNVAVSGLLQEAFEAMGLRWPGPDYDVEEQKARLLAAPTHGGG